MIWLSKDYYQFQYSAQQNVFEIYRDSENFGLA